MSHFTIIRSTISATLKSTHIAADKTTDELTVRSAYNTTLIPTIPATFVSTNMHSIDQVCLELLVRFWFFKYVLQANSSADNAAITSTNGKAVKTAVKTTIGLAKQSSYLNTFPTTNHSTFRGTLH